LGRITGPRSGEIKWYDRRRGYGLIADDNGGTVFVHVSAVKAQRRRLRKGNRLSYLVEITEHGEQARRVQMAPSGREAG
jgi:CspA family cold shock protein